MITRTEKVHLSRTVKIFTAITIAIVIIVGIGIPLHTLIDSRDNTERYITLGIMLFMIAAFIPVFMYAPKRISLSDKQLILYKGMGKLQLPYSEMADICIYRPGNNIVDIRTFGIGGVFGFIGRFYNKEIGNYTSYVGDYSQAFFIRMKSGKKYVLSCENAQDIVASIRCKIASDQ